MSIPGTSGLPLAIPTGVPQSPVDALLNLVNSNPFVIGTSMLMMNLGGRFLSMELTRGQETFLQHPWVRRIILFVILFMGTRNVAIAGLMWLVVVVLIGYVFNENSAFCIFGQSQAIGTTCAGSGVTSISGFSNPPTVSSDIMMKSVENSGISGIAAPPVDRTVTLPPAPSAGVPAQAIKSTEEAFVPCPGALTPEEADILGKLSRKVDRYRFIAKDESVLAPVVAAPPSPVVVSLPFVEEGQNGPMSSRPGEAGPGWGQGNIPSARIYDINAGVVGAYAL